MSADFHFLCNRAGLQRPTVEVRFEHISVTARVLVGQKGQDTVLNYYGRCIAVRILQAVHIRLIIVQDSICLSRNVSHEGIERVLNAPFHLIASALSAENTCCVRMSAHLPTQAQIDEGA